ncbi:MAG: hypothetical protein M1838_002630 [Thelocarpon superellum]|nr:MAG: hypothetical protein M1838_002630 [Thelocarpon superellum]
MIEEGSLEKRDAPRSTGTPPSARSTSEPWSVQAVVTTLPPPLPKAGTPSPVPFFHLLARLKTTPREGWRRFNIHHGESIADHMYRMSLLTMFAPPSLASRLDVARCTQMALVHDMAESLVGDITPVDNVPKAEKSRREAATMDYLADDLLGQVHGGLVGAQLKEVWEEYEQSETLESQFVHDIDKLELLLQMTEYEQTHRGEVDLSEFAYVAKKIILPEVREWSAEVLKERQALWEGWGKEPEGTSTSDPGTRQPPDEYHNQSGQ